MSEFTFSISCNYRDQIRVVNNENTGEVSIWITSQSGDLKLKLSPPAKRVLLEQLKEPKYFSKGR